MAAMATNRTRLRSRQPAAAGQFGAWDSSCSSVRSASGFPSVDSRDASGRVSVCASLTAGCDMTPTPLAAADDVDGREDCAANSFIPYWDMVYQADFRIHSGIGHFTRTLLLPI